MSNDPRSQPLSDVQCELIRQKANTFARRGFITRSEVPDFEQELAVALLKARDRNPQPMCPAAFTRTVLKNASLNLIRYSRHPRRYPDGLTSFDQLPQHEAEAALVSEGSDGKESRDLPSAELALDVAEAVAGLPAELKLIAEALKTHSIAGAARQLNIPRTTLHERIRQLREHFMQTGLRDYLGPVLSN